MSHANHRNTFVSSIKQLYISDNVHAKPIWRMSSDTAKHKHCAELKQFSDYFYISQMGIKHVIKNAWLLLLCIRAHNSCTEYFNNFSLTNSTRDVIVTKFILISHIINYTIANGLAAWHRENVASIFTCK